MLTANHPRKDTGIAMTMVIHIACTTTRDGGTVSMRPSCRRKQTPRRGRRRPCCYLGGIRAGPAREIAFP